MRKPPEIKKATGEYIPRSAGKTSLDKNSKATLADALGKLDGQQLFQLSQAAIDLAGEFVRYGNERQKTQQMGIHASVRLKELDVEDKKNALDHARDMGEIEERREDHRLSHAKAMHSLNNEGMRAVIRHEQIQRLLDLIDAGKLSADQLIDLLSSIDRGN